MSLSRRLRTIALSQIQAIQERLNRIDHEAAEEAAQRRYRRDAASELDDPTDIRPTMRSPEEIASGSPRPPAARTTPPQVTSETPKTTAPVPVASPLAVHYKVLGLEDGADFAAVQSTYNKLAVRCDPTRFPAGSEAQQMAEGIRKRIDAAYEALRDAMDSTAGRFDKLEFE